jgi:hypothetical protein
VEKEKKDFKTIRFVLSLAWIKRKKNLRTLPTWEEIAKRGIENIEKANEK